MGNLDCKLKVKSQLAAGRHRQEDGETDRRGHIDRDTGGQGRQGGRGRDGPT